MSKVDELREKYKKITPSAFEKFVEADKTPTKKYLEYMLKLWQLKNEGQTSIPSIAALINEVKRFDGLLPYIEHKDIYSSSYFNFLTLKSVNLYAEAAKNEKTFVKEEHILVLDETDEYILLQPKTHRGSLKYGANTKWCVASKNDESTFRRYKNGGCLVYLIDKTNTAALNYSKLAFYLTNPNKFIGDIIVYNALDTAIGDKQILSNGWKADVIIRATFIVRSFAAQWEQVRSSINNVDRTMATLKNLNLETLEEDIKLIGNATNFAYLSKAKEVISSFTNKLKEIQNGFTTAKN